MDYKMVLFNAKRVEEISKTMNSEIAAVIHNLDLDTRIRSPRRSLSRQIISGFEDKNWKRSTNLYFKKSRRGTPHYSKNRILAIASWRHYEKIGSEMLKFQVDYNADLIQGGVYICLSNSLVEHLICSAKKKGVKPISKTSITLEKAVEYLEEVKSIVNIPIAVYGLLAPEHIGLSQSI